MSDPIIIALVGISGVGKTTFLKKLSLRVDFQHLTAGSLISQARNTEEQSRDDLRLANVDENQRLLIKGFELACDRSIPRVILDGHCIIHSHTGIQYIDSEVFSELNVKLMVHLEADPQQIISNRSSDHARNRPPLEVDDLRIHQSISLNHAQVIASKLGIPFQRLKHSDLDIFIEVLSFSQ